MRTPMPYGIEKKIQLRVIKTSPSIWYTHYANTLEGPILKKTSVQCVTVVLLGRSTIFPCKKTR